MTTTDSDLSLALAQLSLMLAGFASVAISIRPIRVRDEDAPLVPFVRPLPPGSRIRLKPEGAC